MGGEFVKTQIKRVRSKSYTAGSEEAKGGLSSTILHRTIHDIIYTKLYTLLYTAHHNIDYSQTTDQTDWGISLSHRKDNTMCSIG